MRFSQVLILVFSLTFVPSNTFAQSTLSTLGGCGGGIDCEFDGLSGFSIAVGAASFLALASLGSNSLKADLRPGFISGPLRFGVGPTLFDNEIGFGAGHFAFAGFLNRESSFGFESNIHIAAADQELLFIAPTLLGMYRLNSIRELGTPYGLFSMVPVDVDILMGITSDITDTTSRPGLPFGFRAATLLGAFVATDIEIAYVPLLNFRNRWFFKWAFLTSTRPMVGTNQDRALAFGLAYRIDASGNDQALHSFILEFMIPKW